jgi:ABC-type bacteriocin/lantibiotic exporter with double-glycine peptidase domain
MKNTLIGDMRRGKDFINAVSSWVMVLLTLVFIALYGVVLFGGFNHLLDDRMISHLEPVIFVVIGYFFGRLPARQNEKSLKEEINRQNMKTEAAQQAKEQLQQAREALEEKIKNVRAILLSSAAKASSATGRPINGSADSQDHSSGAVPGEAFLQTVDTALMILSL